MHSSTIARWVILKQFSVEHRLSRRTVCEVQSRLQLSIKKPFRKDVLKLVDWSSASTFNRFYNKLIIDMPAGWHINFVRILIFLKRTCTIAVSCSAGSLSWHQALNSHYGVMMWIMVKENFKSDKRYTYLEGQL